MTKTALQRFAPALMAACCMLLLSCSIILDSDPKRPPIDADAEGDIPADRVDIDEEPGTDDLSEADDVAEPDVEEEEIVQQCFPEDCNGIDDDGDGNVDETCSTSIRFSDSNPAQGDFLDIITIHDQDITCVELVVTGNGEAVDVPPILKKYARPADNFYKWDWTLPLEQTGEYVFMFNRACDTGCYCPSSDHCDCEYTDCGCTTDAKILEATLHVGDFSDEQCGDEEDNDGDGSVNEGCINSLRFSDRNPPAGSVIEVIGTNEWGLTCASLIYNGEVHFGDFIIIHYDDDTNPAWYKFDWWVALPDIAGTYDFQLAYQYSEQGDCFETCTCEPQIARNAYLEVGPPKDCP